MRFQPQIRLEKLAGPRAWLVNGLFTSELDLQQLGITNGYPLKASESSSSNTKALKTIAFKTLGRLEASSISIIPHLQGSFQLTQRHSSLLAFRFRIQHRTTSVTSRSLWI
jgi:hypothetical protein